MNCKQALKRSERKHPFSYAAFSKHRLKQAACNGFNSFDECITSIKRCKIGNCHEFSFLAMAFFAKAIEKKFINVAPKDIYLATVEDKETEQTLSPDHVILVIGDYIVDPYQSQFYQKDQYQNATLPLISLDSFTLTPYSPDKHRIVKMPGCSLEELLKERLSDDVQLPLALI